MTLPHALITGGSRGIGRAIAYALADTHHLLIGGQDRARAEEIAAGLPSAEPFVADLTDPEATAAAVRGIERLDVLIHSAGITDAGRVEDLTREQWRRLYEVNVIAVADLTRLLLPALRTAGGQVVVINSGSGFNAGPGNGAYAASKFALRAFTDALREEERGAVRVCSIHPGRTDTDMQVETQAMMGNTDYDGSLYVRPESVAAAVRTAVEATPEAMIETLSIRPVNK